MPSKDRPRRVPGLRPRSRWRRSSPRARGGDVSRRDLERVDAGATAVRCHTNYPFLMCQALARRIQIPAPSPRSAPSSRTVSPIGTTRDRTPKPRWDAEVVATAKPWPCTTRRDDRDTTPSHPRRTRPDVDTPEARRRLGLAEVRLAAARTRRLLRALVAALAAGHAPRRYARQDVRGQGLERLRGYFRKNAPPDLHHQA